MRSVVDMNGHGVRLESKLVSGRGSFTGPAGCFYCDVLRAILQMCKVRVWCLLGTRNSRILAIDLGSETSTMDSNCRPDSYY
jgi:hypothetical protein